MEATNQADDRVSEVLNDLEVLDYPELLRVQKRVERLVTRERKRAQSQALEELRATAASHGFRLDDLLGDLGDNGKRRKVPPKFRHPDDPRLTWTGRGLEPVWVREWKAQGGSIEDLRIAGEG